MDLNKLSPDERNAVNVITQYMRTSGAGDVIALRALFADGAQMSGFRQGKFEIGSPEPFFDKLEQSMPPDESDTAYCGEITSVEVAGSVAAVTLEERGFLGMDFTNLFHLGQIDGAWQIVSKTYHHHRP